MTKKDFLIVGLGNPGAQYENTRHNIGFLVVDALARSWCGDEFREKWEGLYLPLNVRNHKVHLLKPLTYMNRSGKSVSQFFRFFKLRPTNLLVVQDDLDMAPARIKLVKGGGSGGHKGITSIAEQLGTKDFYRLKIGIGRPGRGDVHPDFPVEKFVLSNFTDDEMALMDSRLKDLEIGLNHFLDDDAARAMGVLNSLK